jgi:hypothetical protein
LTLGEHFHPIYEILEHDFLDGALMGVGSFKPFLSYGIINNVFGSLGKKTLKK